MGKTLFCIFKVLIFVALFVACDPAKSSKQDDDAGDDEYIKKHRVINILFDPPFDTANCYCLPDTSYTIYAPVKNINNKYVKWQFDETGDTVFSDFLDVNKTVLKFEKSGFFSVACNSFFENGNMVPADNNKINVISGGSGNFSFLAGFNGISSGIVGIVDIDMDSRLDIAMTGLMKYEADTKEFISNIMRNDDTNLFAEYFPFALQSLEDGALKFADFNNDGYYDYVLSGHGYAEKEYIFAGVYINQDTVGEYKISSRLTGVRSSGIGVGDIDRDGDLDIVLTGNASLNIDEVSYINSVYKNDGEGNFSEYLKFNNTLLCRWPLFGDLDNDGDLDLILSGSNGVEIRTFIYENDGSGNFEVVENSNLPGFDDPQMKLGDFDKDGDLDLIVMGKTVINNEIKAAVKLYFNNGNFDFTDSNNLFVPLSGMIAAGDIDGDQYIDILMVGVATDTASYNGVNHTENEYYFYKYLNDKKGKFSTVSDVISSKSEAFKPVNHGTLDLADFDNDNDLDIFVTGYNGIDSESYAYLLRNE